MLSYEVAMLLPGAAAIFVGRKFFARMVCRIKSAVFPVQPHEMEGIFREMFQRDPQAMFVVAREREGEFHFLGLNPAALAMLAANEGDLSARSLREIMADSGNDECRRILRGLSPRLEQAVNSGKPVSYECTFGFGNGGATSSCVIHLLPTNTAAGGQRVLCYAQDNNAEKMYMRELAYRDGLEERLGGFEATAPGFFYSYRHGLDGSNTMPFASAGIGDLFGLRPQDVTQSIAALNLLTHRDDMARVIGAIARSAAELSPMQIEFRTQHAEKGELWIESRAVPVQKRDGSIVWHGFMHDITARKHIEQQLQETQGKLRQLVISRELLREDERKRVAWEMHEELGQTLVAAKMRLGSLVKRLPSQTPAPGQECRDICALLDESIVAVRDIVAQLRPTALSMGVAAALEWLVAQYQQRGGTECRLVCYGEERAVGDELTTLVFRLAEEVLDNATQYGGDGQVILTWCSDPQQSSLMVHSTAPLPLAEAQGGENSLRLFGIEERAKALGGEMMIHTTDIHGISLEVYFSHGLTINAA